MRCDLMHKHARADREGCYTSNAWDAFSVQLHHLFAEANICRIPKLSHWAPRLLPTFRAYFLWSATLSSQCA